MTNTYIILYFGIGFVIGIFSMWYMKTYEKDIYDSVVDEVNKPFILMGLILGYPLVAVFGVIVKLIKLFRL